MVTPKNYTNLITAFWLEFNNCDWTIMAKLSKVNLTQKTVTKWDFEKQTGHKEKKLSLIKRIFHKRKLVVCSPPFHYWDGLDECRADNRDPTEIFLWDSIQGRQCVCVCVCVYIREITISPPKKTKSSLISPSFCCFSSSSPRPNRHLRGGGVASLLQQEQNRGAVTDREVLLLPGPSGRHHQSRPVLCRWYAPAEYFMGLFFFSSRWRSFPQILRISFAEIIDKVFQQTMTH